MTEQWTVFDKNGAHAFNLSGQLLPQDVPVGHIAESGWYSDAFYLDQIGVVAKRSLELYYSNTTIPADGSRRAEIQVPNFAGIFVTGPNGVRAQMTDDTVLFSSPEPGSYTLIFDGVEVHSVEVIVNVA